MTISEYPPETPGVDGTGLTEAVCPKHGVKRTVSADGLLAKGAPVGTFALKCLIPLDKKAADAKKAAAGTPPTGAFDVSANGTTYASKAAYDTTLCQEVLVPVESFNDAGVQVRRNGKAIELKDQKAAPRTGGEKLSGVRFGEDGKQTKAKPAKAEKNTAAKRGKKVDSRGGKGVSVAEED